MKTLSLFLKTKNKKSLKNFLFFFEENNFINFHSLKKKFSKTKSKTIFTILKSPHVNKKAQEQFEIKTFNLQLTILTTQIFKFLIFLKRIKNSVFSDIHIKIKVFSSLKKQKSIKTMFDIDNFKINSVFQQKEIIKLKKIDKFKISKNNVDVEIVPKYIKLISFYGKK
jgi:ribosomal protein S10